MCYVNINLMGQKSQIEKMIFEKNCPKHPVCYVPHFIVIKTSTTRGITPMICYCIAILPGVMVNSNAIQYILIVRKHIVLIMHSPDFELTPRRLACFHSDYTDNRLVRFALSTT